MAKRSPLDQVPAAHSADRSVSFVEIDEDKFWAGTVYTVDFALPETDYGQGGAAQILDVGNVSVRRRSFTKELYVTGEVTNVGTAAIESGHVAAVFLDADGNIIGASFTNLLSNVDVGETKAFETIIGNPIKLATVADVVVRASTSDFL